MYYMMVPKSMYIYMLEVIHHSCTYILLVFHVPVHVYVHVHTYWKYYVYLHVHVYVYVHASGILCTCTCTYWRYFMYT